MQNEYYLGQGNCAKSAVLNDTWISYNFECEKYEENSGTKTVLVQSTKLLVLFSIFYAI